MHLLERIAQWEHLTPQRIAHTCQGRSITYRELGRRSDLLAAELIRRLPDDNAPVALLGHKESEMLVGMLGCMKSRHPYIPIDSSIPPQRAQAICAAAKAALVLDPQRINEIVEAGASTSVALRNCGPQDAWYVIFTSGSTGEPKGVIITRECIESFVDWTLQEQEFKVSNEIFLNQAPFSFDLSVMDLYSSLAVGGTLFSIAREEMTELKRLFQVLSNSGVSIWVSTPSFARLCLMDSSFHDALLPQVRKFWFCGETLAPDIAANLIDRFPGAEVWNTYGPTEATVATTSIRVTRELLAQFNPLPVGRPKPGTLVEVHGTDGGPLPAGERGEIIIAGPNVSTGYIHRPDLTGRAFFQYRGQRAYHTGDSGHLQDGLVFFDGRMDFQIKLHGYRIEIGDIEAHLHALAEVRDAVVIPAIKDGQADHLVAFVIAKGGAPASEYEAMRQMKRDLSERLPEYMVPRRFVFLPEFPITINGKADRRKLADILA